MAPLLLDLPVELLYQISSQLPNSAIKTLRLTCLFAHMVFRLRFNRVFLSPHQRDIDVFCQVASSETFRHQIVQLVWDQNRFCLGNIGDRDSFNPLYQFTPFNSSHELATEMVRFQRNRIANTGCLISNDFSAPSGNTMFESRIAKINKYVQMRREANELSNSDAFALEYYITRFPSLRQIIISHSTNGWLFQPFYETPLIRSFPSRFIYDVERSDFPSQPLTRISDRTDWSEYSKTTRGYRTIFKALAAAKELQLEDIVIEAPSGVNCGLPFDFFTLGMTSDYLNFVELLRRQHLRRFDLTITIWTLIRDYENQSHPPVRLLKDALREAASLTHFSFKVDCADPRPDVDWVPLKALLPVDRWPNLRHFELSYFTVKQNDLADLLGELPRSIRSIELGFLVFFEESESLAGLLDEILRRAFWDERDEMNRPHLGISLRVSRRASRSIAIRVDAEIESFLYKQGMNPFRGARGPNHVELGIGTERDTFNPECEWPCDQNFGWKKQINMAQRWVKTMSKREQYQFDRIGKLVEKIEDDADDLAYDLADELPWAF
ncbi:unnamed protein product [Clonostachys solani]|uniref:F-box domain-containing protein n=1 Tax=Clonostachys solani TaxID=160281 RepID=A0A9N9YST3_9HYPO|nr:unnamed protein product [Clonostachys solani]